MKPYRRYFILGTYFIVLILFNNVTYAFFADEGQQGAESEYAAGEVLVKFKEGVDPQRALRDIKLEVMDLDRIYSIAPIIAKVKKDYKLEKDAGGWYWFRGKKYKAADDIKYEEWSARSGRV